MKNFTKILIIIAMIFIVGLFLVNHFMVNNTVAKQGIDSETGEFITPSLSD